MESTLSLSLDDLAGDVGVFLGHGRGAANGEQEWDDQQQANVTSCVKSGLRQFYFPPPLPNETASYDWSFLKPLAVLVLPEGARSLRLPDDFGGPEGQITVLGTTTAQTPWAVPLMGEGSVRQNYALTPSRTGRPLMAALVPLKATTKDRGQRYELLVYPEADADYSLQFPYYVNPDHLTAANPYPLGGMQHAETIREACLAAAESFLDDGASVHRMMFAQRLAASVHSDRRLKPQTLGYNRDRSDQAHAGVREALHYLNHGGITVNGVQY